MLFFIEYIVWLYGDILSVFSHPAVFSLENVQSSMYIFYVYFSDMASPFLGNNMSTTMWLIHPKSYLCATVNTFAVTSSYVPEFAVRLHKPNDASGAFTKNFPFDPSVTS